MNTKRIAVFAGAIGVLSTIIKEGPGILLNTLFEQGLPSWLPILGERGQTVLLYSHSIDIVGALVMLALSIGTGSYVSQRINLSSEYMRLLRGTVAGTTIPFILLWAAGIGISLFVASDWFNVIVVTTMALRMLTTISLPVTIGIFAGASLTNLSRNDQARSEMGSSNSGFDTNSALDDTTTTNRQP